MANQTVTVRQASRLTGVPNSTLWRWVKLMVERGELQPCQAASGRFAIPLAELQRIAAKWHAEVDDVRAAHAATKWLLAWLERNQHTVSREVGDTLVTIIEGLAEDTYQRARQLPGRRTAGSN